MTAKVSAERLDELIESLLGHLEAKCGCDPDQTCSYCVWADALSRQRERHGEAVGLLRDLRDGPINASDYGDSAASIDAFLAQEKP